MMSTESPSGINASVGDSALPLHTKKQSALLGFIFQPQTKVFSYLIDVCQKSWWSQPLHGTLWELITEFYAEYKKPPMLADIKFSSKLLRRELAEQKRLQNLLDEAITDSTQFHFEPLREEITVWLQAKILQNAYTRGIAFWNTTKYNESTQILRDVIKELNSTRFINDYERKVIDFAEIAKDLGPANVLPFGVSGVDNHLFPNNPKGSLRKGDQTVIMAPVNMGKSTTLITSAVHNIRACNDVLFVSHEGHRSDLRLKMIRCYLTLMDEAELRKVFPKIGAEKVGPVLAELHAIAAMELIDIVFFMASLPEPGTEGYHKFKRFGAVMAQMQKHITFMPIHKPGMNVEEIATLIERKQEKWKEDHRDADGQPKGYDLFVCDYPGVLSTRENNKGNMAWRHVQQRVYDTFVQLALANEWHSLVAIQTNRDGSKINNHTAKNGERRFLTNEDVAECWGAIMSASTVITVNRSPEAQAAGRVTFLISKSRSSATGYAVSCFGNFKQGVSHADSLGFISYYGTSESKNLMDTYLKPGSRRILTPAETGPIIMAENH